MGFKRQEQNQPNPPWQDSPIPHMPRKQTPRQPTPGPNPSQHDEPPIPGPSPSSKPLEDIPTCEPEPEVAPMQSTEEHFACPATPRSVIIINDIAPKNPTASSPHSHDDALQEFTNLRPTLMIP
ncbi:hypothetical protein O181_072134 [Austropuccinia psidii MF-1]|uniref:Uncharacterized protein n=1 Tax=Austropuccinia psidii MF-1 TaxID=1389203 RepID=A0A9Q3IB70_9BASI|nr:hypothetical protein [Austropuccinia psidii MF-1]